MTTLSDPAPHETVPARRGLLAIGLALLAFLLFTAMDTTVKAVATDTSVVQAGFFNALFAMLPIGFAIGRRGVWCLATRAWKLHGLRGVLGTTGLLLTFFAYSQMPLADVYAVLFTMPLIITALAGPLLGERAGWASWGAILVGFLGVMVMLQPGTGVLGVPALAALTGAIFTAGAFIVLRILHRTETTEACVLYGNLATLLALGAMLPFAFVMPSAGQLGLSALGGLLGGIAFLLLTAAYARAPASLVAPFQYSQMPYGLLSGFLLYGSLPTSLTLLGAAIVIGSGLFILAREAVGNRSGTGRVQAADPLA